jgi:hypothetical protein
MIFINVDESVHFLLGLEPYSCLLQAELQGLC